VRTNGARLRKLGELPRGTRYDVVTLSPTGWAFWVKGNKWIYGQKAGRKPHKIATFGGGTVIDERVVPSPDGRRLAVVGYGRGEVESVFTLRLDGSDRTLVYQGSGLGKEIYDVSWSPDGSRLILSDGTGGESDPKGELPVHSPRQWFLVPSDGSNPAGTVLPLAEQVSSPFFSPEGTRLAFTVNWGDGPQLTIAGLEGHAPRTVPGTTCRGYCEFTPRVVGWG
jgi:Tol biopolymer transport system component